MRRSAAILIVLLSCCISRNDEADLAEIMLTEHYDNLDHVVETAVGSWGLPELLLLEKDDPFMVFLIKCGECGNTPYLGITAVAANLDLTIKEAVIVVAVDLAERQNVNPAVVLAHEIGHVLGFGHSDNPADLMYYKCCRAQEPSEDELRAIHNNLDMTSSPRFIYRRTGLPAIKHARPGL